VAQPYVSPEPVMTFRLVQLPCLCATALLMSACGLWGDKKPEYYDVPEAKPLKIPSGLDSPTSEAAFTIGIPAFPLPESELNPIPPRVLANQAGQGGNSSLRWSADGVYILIQDSPDSVQRRLGYVIERSGMEMVRQEPDGAYVFQYQQVTVDRDEGFFTNLAFWRPDAPNYSGSYQTLLEPDGNSTRIYVKYADGRDVPMEAAEQVLAILKERLG